MFIRGEFKHRRTTNKECLQTPNLLSESYISCFTFRLATTVRKVLFRILIFKDRDLVLTLAVWMVERNLLVKCFGVDPLASENWIVDKFCVRIKPYQNNLHARNEIKITIFFFKNDTNTSFLNIFKLMNQFK